MLGSCQQADPNGTDEADDGTCARLEQHAGRRVCVAEIPDRSTWDAISYELAAIDQARSTTYLVPATPDAPLSTLFVDAAAFDMPEQSLHYRFLTEAVPELELLSYDEYLELTQDPARRELFAGSLTELVEPGQQPRFGFTVWDRGVDPDATVACAAFQMLHTELAPRVGIGALVVMPANDLQRETLETCDVPSHDAGRALEHETYTRGKGCGTLRRFTLQELTAADAAGEIGWQDVLVVDEAPLDVASIIAGILTGTRQGELSHLNVRSASRGTPNCYLAQAYAATAEWEGKRIELECGPSGVYIREISAQQAQACFDGKKPEPVEVVAADTEWSELTGLLELPTDTPEARRLAVARFGSKGTNLATLYQRIDAELRLDGFLIPAYYHEAFMRSQGFDVDLGDGEARHGFAEVVAAWLADPAFLTDGGLRRERLAALRNAMRSAPCDADLVDAIGAHIVASHGSDDVMVRFRSSSNAEDALGFNGAGLYDSTSVCLADGTDGDELGPSRCDPDQPDERDVCRGLRKVWASLWNDKAFEEREWYGIDHTGVRMGILVNTRTKGELANVVAFTGNPLLRGDDRFLVNAQLGELDVVAAQPGVWPEKVLLTIEEGEVAQIERARGSTELPEGEWVLSEAQLRELGAELSAIAELYPIDGEAPPTADVLLDTEWKLRADGRLAIKQVRPFLR